MPHQKELDALVCDLLGGCAVDHSDMVSSIRVGDGAHHAHPSAERVVKLVDSISGGSRWIADDVRTAGQRVLLVFQDSYEPCGEIHTQHGSFNRAVMTGLGETAIGDRLREWQVRGVPRVRLASDARQLIETREPLRSPSFHVVAILWLGSQGYRVIDTSSALLGVWQRVINHSHSDASRYKMMESASRASLPELATLFSAKPQKLPVAKKKKVRA